MKKKWRSALILVFVGMMFLGGFTIHSIIKLQSYGKVINYVSIVRGATQRLIKLELAGQPNDNMIVYLDGVLDELITGRGQYGIVRFSDAEYQGDLSQLAEKWIDLKEEIWHVRDNPQDVSTLLADSETYFVLANETVFSAQNYSEAETSQLLGMIVALFICVLGLWMLMMLDDAKKMMRLENSNKDLAGRDSLTGAYGAERFKAAAQALLDKNLETKYAVFYLDFEDFKYINDVFGYAYGDEILRKYAVIMQEELREGEIFGRVNADHFIALKKYVEKDEILIRQRALDQKIIEYMRNSHDKHSLPICCGICCLEDVVESLKIEGLLDRANFARKTVKQGANKNYAFYNESIRRRLMEENSIRSSLVNAFRNQEFKVYYQPKFDLKRNRIACSEALVRWIQSDGTVISPDEFIPILERDRNISALDQYVFEEVCKWLNTQLARGNTVLPVSVNVSRLQFYDPDFVETYRKIRDRYGVPPELLEVEFTETIVFDNMALLLQIVEKLKKVGFTCCIDDFGKGYSSLSLLTSLPIDVLKIDRQFFVNMDEEGKDRLVVRGIVDIVRQLHITTVAEGIETEEQVEFLKGVHCDLIQGYVFYRPMPQKDFEKVLLEMEPEQKRLNDEISK